MKKLFVILLGLMCGWLCGISPCMGDVRNVESVVESVVEASDQDELRCEREYNSDLGVPRTVVDITPASIPALRLLSCSEKLGVKCGVVCGHDGTRVACLPRFRTNFLLSGGDAVDFYIYRLRRLII